MAQTTKRADFEAIFPSLAQDILAHAKRYNLPANALEWFENVSAPFLIFFFVLLND
jgi:farnesyl diphosphate synthase